MISLTEKRQFRALYRVFLLRIVDCELLSSRGDVSKVVGQVAALLAAFGFTYLLLTVPLYAFASRSMLVASWADQAFLIETTMAIAGLMMVIAWQSLFPSRLDMLALGATPVRERTLMCAKVSSVAAAVFAACVALNAFTGLVFPFLSLPTDAGLLAPLRAIAAYWIAVMTAAFAVVCTLATLQGALALTLPYRVFVRASGYCQIACVFTIITAYFLKPPFANPATHLSLNPSAWFLGLAQRLNGSAHPAFGVLSERAIWTVALSGAAALLSYFLAYRRTMKGIVEQRDAVPTRQSARLALVWLSSRPLDRALLLFTVRTLVRSRQHRLMLAAWMGLGLAMALLYLRDEVYRPKADWSAPNVSLLGFGVVLLFFILVGIRCLATVPCELRANWIFRITESRPPLEYFHATRRTLFIAAGIPLCLALALLYAAIWPWGVAARHVILLALFTVILTNLALADFRKIPFTCSYLPGKANLNVRLGVYTLLFFFITDIALRMEVWALKSSVRFLLLATFAACVAFWMAHRSRRVILESPAGLVFDEVPAAELMALDLSVRAPMSSLPEGRLTRTVAWRTVIARFVAATLVLAGAGYTWQAGAEWQDRRRFPRIGQAVDVGGRSLNLHCLGEGGPIVVFDSGLNVPGYSWIKVQAEVSSFVRACWFDRAGYGWSDPAPPPRTSEENARVMRQMLQAAGLEPPYILVGHSYGGFNTRVFASRYRNEVAGLVLVDAAYENDETDPRMRIADPPLKKLLPGTAITGIWPYLSRIGLIRLFADPPGSQGVLSGHDAALLQAQALQSKSVDAFIQEGRARQESAAQVRAIRTYGDLPLVVISGGKIDDAGFYRIWVEDIQARLTLLSARSRQVVAMTSGHAIPYEAPEAIASSIRDLVHELR